MQTVIYGAQGNALTTYHLLKALYPETSIQAFVVSNRQGNPARLADLPVYEMVKFLAQSKIEKSQLRVIVATADFVMGEIVAYLKTLGITHYECITSAKLTQLQERYYAKQSTFRPLKDYPVGEQNIDLKIFQTKSHKDKAVQNQQKQADYLHEIQVGAALTKKRLATLCDCQGSRHISLKNPNYSELTGLYWVWQNLTHEKPSPERYYGLAHYRRIFQFSPEDLQRIGSNQIDVILPFPLRYEPTMESHHRRCVTDEQWQAALQALAELHPETFAEYQTILKQSHIVLYNMFVAREEVFVAYCQWLFPVLERIEAILAYPAEKQPSRYIGYLGESLTTLYFFSCQKQLKIAYSGCQMII